MHKRFHTLGSILLFLLGTAALAQDCEPADTPMLAVRLDTFLASDQTKAGTEFQTTVIAPVKVGAQILIPIGSTVFGSIRRASSVGLGIVRERAELKFDFHAYEVPGGERYSLVAQLVSIDNAREKVTRDGTVKGILAADNAQKLVRGIWFRPTPQIVTNSLAGLTGASGRLWTQFAMGPGGAVGLFVVRLAAFPFPEPEIHLPPGTEMHLQLTGYPSDAPIFPLPRRPVDIGEPLSGWLRSRPVDVIRGDQRSVIDTVNLAFVGTADRLINAFTVAGWKMADPAGPSSFSHAYKAFASMQGYPTAPVSPLYYQGALPELVFQKSLNTLARRHHIRIWNAGTVGGNQVWLAAATHDTGVAFQKTSMAFTHTVDPHIDRERDKVVDDLVLTGCAVSASNLERPDATLRSQADKGALSDGQLAIVTLLDCPASAAWQPIQTHRTSVRFRLARRTVLEARQYLLRDNIYYYGYELAKSVLRRRGVHAEE